MQSVRATSSGARTGCAPSSSKYCPSIACRYASSARRRVASSTSLAGQAQQQQQQQPQPFFDDAYLQGAEPSAGVPKFVRTPPQTYTPPSIRDTGTLRPGPEWYPAWMKYKRREDNYVFWQDKFSRCSLDVPDSEKRWTLFSTVWFTVVELKYFFVPPALRYLWFLAYRAVMARVYEVHKALVLWQCKLDAHVASQGSQGTVQAFSKTMALRRLHWKNCLLGEVLYLLNLYKTGRVALLPPVKRPFQRPTFFWLF